jgi:2-phospho-L-lactate guanylyltransferase
VQATVSFFDEATRSGRVLLDDGRELWFGTAALEGSGVRLLRAGQRVRLDVSDAGPGLQVRRVRIITLP